jgi:hypothetical protein
VGRGKAKILNEDIESIKYHVVVSAIISVGFQNIHSNPAKMYYEVCSEARGCRGMGIRGGWYLDYNSVFAGGGKIKNLLFMTTI